ncbi:MAG TPA: hypothetical protein VFX85_02625 [Solirubrobacterales bacterium]|nr:hypothetical protein [Solirubrobacterales bacterium]
MSRPGKEAKGQRRGNRKPARLGRWLAGFVLAGMLLGVAPASATFHLIKVREVYPAGSASYVMLQMLELGENQVAGHPLVAYNANGTIASNFNLPNSVDPNSPNNATILIAGPGYSAAFPGGPTPDEAHPTLNLSPSGGAVCWTEGEPPDCVAWGNFTGPLPAHSPPYAVGSPASPGGVTAGKALRRTIEAGCETSFEGTDDSDNSAADFSEVTPLPRNNAMEPTEEDCRLPSVILDSKPPNPTTAKDAEFVFHSDPPGAALECKLDTQPFTPCIHDHEEPFVYPGPLPDGSHTFQVRATNTKGTGLSTVYTWLVDTTPPTTTIKSSPANPSPGASATFTYEASQLGSTFKCAISPSDIFDVCPPTGMTYTGLPEGSYTFKVFATDKAGNAGSPATYTWQVNNSPPAPPTTPLVSTPPVLTIPKPPSKTPTTVKCKKGFVKKKVKGKTRCVKKPKKKK